LADPMYITTSSSATNMPAPRAQSSLARIDRAVSFWSWKTAVGASSKNAAGGRSADTVASRP
jgi:hypothetical protein